MCLSEYPMQELLRFPFHKGRLFISAQEIRRGILSAVCLALWPCVRVLLQDDIILTTVRWILFQIQRFQLAIAEGRARKNLIINKLLRHHKTHLE